MRRLLFALLLLVALPAAADINDIFAAGETLDFDLTWVLVTGGSARMTVGPAPGDPAHYRITSIAKSSSSFSFIFSVRDQIESIINRSDFSTIRYQKNLNEKGKKKVDTTTIDETRKTATRVRPFKRTQQIAVPKPVFDPLSLVYHLRTLPLQPGTVQSFTVFADGKVYLLEARITKRESIDTPAGTFKTVVVEPKMLAGGLFKDEGDLTIWYTDDVRHIPVRIRSDVKVGAITAALRSIRPGVANPEPDSK